MATLIGVTFRLLFKQYSDDAEIKDQITSYPTLGVNFINLNLKEGNGLDDVKVRQALSLAINRQELVDTFAHGNGIACSGWLPQQIPGFDKNAPVFEYDVEKAKALLAEAGVSDLKLTGKVRKASEKLLVAVQDYWQKAGITLDVQVEDNAVWNQDWAGGRMRQRNPRFTTMPTLMPIWKMHARKRTKISARRTIRPRTIF